MCHGRAELCPGDPCPRGHGPSVVAPPSLMTNVHCSFVARCMWHLLARPKEPTSTHLHPFGPLNCGMSTSFVVVQRLYSSQVVLCSATHRVKLRARRMPDAFGVRPIGSRARRHRQRQSFDPARPAGSHWSTPITVIHPKTIKCETSDDRSCTRVSQFSSAHCKVAPHRQCRVAAPDQRPR